MSQCNPPKMQDLLSEQELYNSINNNSNNCYKEKEKV